MAWAADIFSNIALARISHNESQDFKRQQEIWVLHKWKSQKVWYCIISPFLPKCCLKNSREKNALIACDGRFPMGPGWERQAPGLGHVFSEED